jgi:hypothetical protein
LASHRDRPDCASVQNWPTALLKATDTPYDQGIEAVKQGRFTTNSKQYLFIFEQIGKPDAPSPQRTQVIAWFSKETTAACGIFQMRPY